MDRTPIRCIYYTRFNFPNGVNSLLMRLLCPRIAILFALLTAVGLTPAFAQTGTIIGTTTDRGGAVLPGTQITITDVDTNFERTFVTDDHGEYTFSLLPVGSYRIEATLPGFRTSVAENVLLSVDDRFRI